MKTIDKFDNHYAFLSNFHPAPVLFEGITYPTVEHAFQAAKTYDIEQRKAMLHMTPGQAKRAGRRVLLRPDWNEMRVPIMHTLVYEKFITHEDLRNALLATGDAMLIEGNTWHDIFWGVCNGRGENHLGKILMQVREQLREEAQHG